MILEKGRRVEVSRQDDILKRMPEDICITLEQGYIDVEIVVSALDRLSQKIASGAYDHRIAELVSSRADTYKNQAVRMMCRENIEFKVRTELGEDFFAPARTRPPLGESTIQVQPMPLGVLLHIAAGNMDGLPAFSLIEGLLSGNINILKLPQADNGLSIEIIAGLVEIEPRLGDYIYVFDTPSSDIATIKTLSLMADGIVIWGGEAAVSAVRQMAPVGVKLIEWGHKLSFAYISGYEDQDRELQSLADHIIKTDQILCSSCQTIFLDTEDMGEVHRFCERFLPILKESCQKNQSESLGIRADKTLRQHFENINRFLTGNDNSDGAFYQGAGCSLSAQTDSAPELSNMFGHVRVKRLPSKNIVSALRPYKTVLQTAGLICLPEKRESLSLALLRSGVVRVTRGGSMSELFSGEAHDGEYPLRRYVRITNIE